MSVIYKQASISDIVGYKLEPIVDVKINSLYAYEMLAILDENIDSETYFNDVPVELLCELMQRQFSALKNISSNNIVFVNATCDLIINASIVNQIINNHPPNLGIELQDPKNIRLINENSFKSLINNIRKLTSSGIPVWLDDVDLSLYSVAIKLKKYISGIKIDKHEFWNSIDDGYFAFLMEKMSEIGKPIIVEGVETECYLEHLNISQRCYAQGYLWPKILLEN